MKIPIIKCDKANHIIYGFIIYFMFNLFFNSYFCLAIVFIFALSKEVKDDVDYGGFDIKDLLVTMIIPTALLLKELLIIK